MGIHYISGSLYPILHSHLCLVSTDVERGKSETYSKCNIILVDLTAAFNMRGVNRWQTIPSNSSLIVHNTGMV